MPTWMQTLIGGVFTTFGGVATAWAFARLRETVERMNSNEADNALTRLQDIVSTVALDTVEVFSKSLVEALKDGVVEPHELQAALTEASEFAWSLMRNADKKALAGGIDTKAKNQFEDILKHRIDAEARRATTR